MGPDEQVMIITDSFTLETALRPGSSGSEGQQLPRSLDDDSNNRKDSQMSEDYNEETNDGVKELQRSFSQTLYE
jgi:hypothetical protein